jgi:hypothetical protein
LANYSSAGLGSSLHMSAVDFAAADRIVTTLTPKGQTRDPFFGENSQGFADALTYQSWGSGYGYGSYFDFYTKIHVSPLNIPLGNLLAEEERSVFIFNAKSTSETLSSLSLVNGDGITVSTSGVVLPYLMKPLEELELVVTIPAQGAPTLNASLLVTISGIEHRVLLTARRSVLFKPPRDLDVPYRENYQYRTVVSKHRGGSEYRKALRFNPRLSLSYSFKPRTAQGNSRLKMDLMSWGNKKFSVPMWGHQARLTQGVNIGANTLEVDFVNSRFVDGADAVVYLDEENFEFIKMDSVVGDSLNLESPLTASYVAGVKVIPLCAGYVSVGQLTSLTDQTSSSSVTVDVGQSPLYNDLTDLGSAETLNGFDVYSEPVNWVTSPLFSITSNVLRFDVNTLDASALEFANPDFIFEANLFLNYAAAQILKSHFLRCRGGRTPLYFSTDHSDLTLVEAIGLTDSSIVVQGNGLAQGVLDLGLKLGVRILLQDGSVYNRAVETAELSGSSLTVGLNATLGRAISLAEVKKISYLLLGCFDDNLSMQYTTDTQGPMSATMLIRWTNHAL